MTHRGERKKNKDGYIIVNLGKDEYDRWSYTGEHRLVAEIHLGRKLLPRENIHHRNGVRDDNKLKNLELWYVSQPSGQRVSDLIDYVIEYHLESLLNKLNLSEALAAPLLAEQPPGPLLASLDNEDRSAPLLRLPSALTDE